MRVCVYACMRVCVCVCGLSAAIVVVVEDVWGFSSLRVHIDCAAKSPEDELQDLTA